ncbi:MAG: type II CRISPR-associated endonuclease Cas1 [Fibrobacter sp.]|jgi:CRISPR-associated protein Cas1|nr:type II CRISPR-associated endonuclease Cas1 [Fibrobacter sp.]
MIKQTLNFSNPAYLSVKDFQLVIKTSEREITRPIEDIGVIILDNPQITITQRAMALLLENNAVIITTDSKHLPVGMFLNLDGNTLQSNRFQKQIEASEPLKKQLWLQTVQAKIQNQSAVLRHLGKDVKRMEYLAKTVNSGDTNNCEAQAASYYWKLIFEDFINGFSRSPEGNSPNHLLNYGYAILRAATARALVGSGLLPTLGIFHRNQYNAYCLADDIMEPYRPYVDMAVREIFSANRSNELTPEIKKHLLGILAFDCRFEKEKSPMLVALSRTSASLVACFEGKKKKLLYPRIYETECT